MKIHIKQTDTCLDDLACEITNLSLQSIAILLLKAEKYSRTNMKMYLETMSVIRDAAAFETIGQKQDDENLL